MKKCCLLLIFCLLLSDAFSQKMWNKRLPLLYTIDNYVGLVHDNNHFLLHSREGIAEVDQNGEIRGYTKVPLGTVYTNFVRRRYDEEGNISFITGSRHSNYLLRTFKAGEGYSSTLTLADSLGSIGSPLPVVLEVNDSTLLVFGRKMAYKVHVNTDLTCSVIWGNPLSVPGGIAKAAVQANDNFILFTLSGDIVVLDRKGHYMFTLKLPFSFYAAKALPDGIIACGENSANSKAMLMKFNFSGVLLWAREYDDKRYYDVNVMPDGGFVATGTSIGSNIALLRTDGNGHASWSKEYQRGLGVRVIHVPTGGFFIMGAMTGPGRAFAIRTDESGKTTPPDDEFFVENRRLETDGVRAVMTPTASFFQRDEMMNLSSPPDSMSTLNILTLWIGGKDDSNQIHMAADDYISDDESDFHSGVVNGHNGDFKRVWLAKKTDIYKLRQGFLTDHTLNINDLSYDLLTWPARGNIHNQYNLDFTKIKTEPNLQWAPFEDVNGDGIYNILDGDYPKIKGDQMAWWMLNDDSTHLQREALPLKIDVGFSAYLYDCPQNESIKNSLFIELDIINRASKSYDSLYLGMPMDINLGCPYSDGFGSLRDQNTYYAYDRYAVDTDCFGFRGLGTNIPIQSITYQNKALSHFITFGGGDVVGQWDPDFPVQKYRYLQGRWINDVPLTWGNGGYNPGSADYTNHLFPDNPSDPEGWNMCNMWNSYRPNRRILGSHGPFRLSSEDTFNITVAFTAHHGIPPPCPNIFKAVKPFITQLTDWSNAGALDIWPNLEPVQDIPTGQALILGTEIPGAAFQWSNGDTSATIIVYQPREYSVTITNEAGCQSVEKIVVRKKVGTETLVMQPKWNIYPNPASSILHVSCEDMVNGEDRMIAVLRNAQGTVVKKEQSAAPNFTLGVQGFASGFYWLELWQGNTFLGSRKVTLMTR